MSSLKIVTFNVNGLAEKVKRRQIFDYIRRKEVDICFLQETHFTKVNQRIVKSELGGNVLFAHGESNARGVAILFRKNFKGKILKEIKSEEGRYLIVKMLIDDKKFLFVNCYAPNEDSIEFFDNLVTILMEEEVDFPIWGGDFNKTLGKLDKYGNVRETRAAEFLNTFLEQNHWIDVWRYFNPEKTQYTWFRRHPIQCSRLDFFLMPEGQVDVVEDCEIEASFLSDHTPVVMVLKLVKEMRRTGYWKLNNLLLKNKDYVEEINKIILDVEQNMSKLDPMVKWEILKNNVSIFSQDYSRERAKQKRKHIEEIERKINALHKKLKMINLNSYSAISCIGP